MQPQGGMFNAAGTIQDVRVLYADDVTIDASRTLRARWTLIPPPPQVTGGGNVVLYGRPLPWQPGGRMDNAAGIVDDTLHPQMGGSSSPSVVNSSDSTLTTLSIFWRIVGTLTLLAVSALLFWGRKRE